MEREQLESMLIERAWKDDKFRTELLANPKAVIAREAGAAIPDNVNIRVIQEDASTRYLVIPANPTEVSEGELSDDELEAVAGGACSCWRCTKLGVTEE